ncbi:MAG: FecR domain-containing protein [Pseudomonas sp.]|uniref:FecR domain-containing protein n=1 Tax=Pseudomonas sp. TaxID=306 RepID=UPI003D0DADE2
MPTPDARAVEQAIDWLVRLRFNHSDDATREAFEQWLELRPENAQAWLRVTSLGDEFSALPPGLAHSTLKVARHRISRRQSLKLLGTCLAAGGIAWVGREQVPVASLMADYRSGTGERRDVQLEDGTRVRLNSNSAFDVSFGADRRVVELRGGDLLIEPGDDTGYGVPRPFWVRTRNGDLLAHSKRFMVREEDGKTLLAVDQGYLSVLGSNPPLGIQGGQQAQLLAGTLQPDTPTGLDPWGWTDGVISARDMRLDAFLAELARHRPGLLICRDDVMHLRVSGTYQLADTDQVLSLLSLTLPVRLEYRSRYWVTVSAKA